MLVLQLKIHVASVKEQVYQKVIVIVMEIKWIASVFVEVMLFRVYVLKLVKPVTILKKILI